MTLTPHSLARFALAALAAAGLVVPWHFNLAYFASGGSVAPEVFFGAAFANSLTAAITLDVYLAALAFSVGVAADRTGGKPRWLAIPACFFVGLAFALPMYLWWRSRTSRNLSPAASLAQGE